MLSPEIFSNIKWYQPRYPSIDKWVVQTWYIYITEFCSPLKTMKFAGKLIELVNIVREVTQSQKDKYFNVIAHIRIFSFKF